MLPPKESWSRYKTLKVWKIRNKKIIHKPMNKRHSMKHNRTGVVFQEMLEKTKLIGKEREIS
jgi:hypothetical protein